MPPCETLRPLRLPSRLPPPPRPSLLPPLPRPPITRWRETRVHKRSHRWQPRRRRPPLCRAVRPTPSLYPARRHCARQAPRAGRRHEPQRAAWRRRSRVRHRPRGPPRGKARERPKVGRAATEPQGARMARAPRRARRAPRRRGPGTQRRGQRLRRAFFRIPATVALRTPLT